MDEAPPPAFATSRIPVPWYVNTDSVLLNNAKARTDEAAALSRFKGEGYVLKVVNVKAKKIIKGSKNLNGPGEADQIIDEEELVKAGRMTLEELLAKKVKGFYVWRPGNYSIDRKEVRLIFDGYNIDYFYDGKTVMDRMYFMKTFMDYFTAEDITGIEVMNNLKYSMNYNVEYFNSGGIKAMRSWPQPDAKIAYLEITTRSKNGPFMQVVPGTYLYKTLAFSLAKQFYSPKYNVKNKTTALGTDLRCTIFWEPNITTDAKGAAALTFYSSDRPSKYTITVEGTNMDGQLGHRKQQIVITR